MLYSYIEYMYEGSKHYSERTQGSAWGKLRLLTDINTDSGRGSLHELDSWVLGGRPLGHWAGIGH